RCGRTMKDSMLPTELKLRIMNEVRQMPSPSRREVATRSAVLLSSAAAMPLVALFCLGLQFHDRPAALVVRTVGGALLATSAAAWVSMGRGGRALGRARVWLFTTMFAAPAAFVVWKLAASATYPGMTEPWSDRPGIRCFGLTLLFAAWPLA